MANDLVDELLGVEWLRHYPEDSGGNNYPSDAPLRAAAALKAAEAERDKALRIEQTARASNIDLAVALQGTEADITAARSRIAELEKAIDEFGGSRVRDRVAARIRSVGDTFSADILHDALQQEVRRARALLSEKEEKL